MVKEKHPAVTRYIDPLTDFGFKKLFGSEPNKDLLIDLLNTIFRGRKHIVDLVYNKNEHPGDTVSQGGAIFDLTCTGMDGAWFIIEVQCGKPRNFKQRAIFYTSRLISDQAPKGERARWDYQLPEVYLVAILEDFFLDETAPDDHFLHDICLMDRDRGSVFYEGLGCIFIELSKFTKKETELSGDLDKWMYVLKHMNRMDKLPVYLRKPVFEKLFNIAEYSKLTKEEKTMYDDNMKRKWDNYAVLGYAVETAREEGIAEGEARGKAEGIAEGEAKGKAEIARSMKRDGMPPGQIAKFTGLSVEEIEKL